LGLWRSPRRVFTVEPVTRLRAPRVSRGAQRPRVRRSRRTAAPSRLPSESGPRSTADDPPAGPGRVGEAAGRTAGQVAAVAVPSSPRAGIASTSLPSGPGELVAELVTELVADGRVRRTAARVKRLVTTALWLVRTMTWSWPSPTILDEAVQIGRPQRPDLRAFCGGFKCRGTRQTRETGTDSVRMCSPLGL
jgi:hypothetical protein